MKRGAPLKRTGFKRPERPSQPVVIRPIDPDIACRVSDGRGRLSVPLPKPPEPLRSEQYRRIVAKFPCVICGRAGPCQAAHPSTGRGGAQKTDDRLIFPACADSPGRVGCHTKFDQGALFTKTERRHWEPIFARRTICKVLERGIWPAGLPMPEEAMWKESSTEKESADV